MVRDVTGVLALPADLLAALDAEAARRGVPTGAMVERWLRRQLEHVGVRAVQQRKLNGSEGP